jgi:ABC-type multidrug transport system permease subunit
MRDKLNNLKNNPEFQEKLQEMKPKRNIWGILGVVLFFFVPEVVNVLWHKEITAWIMELIHSAPITPMSELLEWMTGKAFTGEVSFFNIGLGIAFLVWIFWDDIKSMLK